MNGEGRPVLILGAGIHGTAVARELVLNRVPVVIVDAADIASGTTAFSSRLIHGGLRYLEYGEFALVRQSLDERTLLLERAPHLVQPLQLFIPIQGRLGGLLETARKLAGASPRKTLSATRGLWLVRTGLALYDRYAKASGLPHHGVHSVGQPAVPRVDERRYRWLCSYFDAQVSYAELLTVALLEDARRIAQHNGTPLQVFTYCVPQRSGGTVRLRPAEEKCIPGISSCSERSLRPTAIVNTTGAWVDRTLARIDVASPRLVGGTRGSHLLTFSRTLRDALQGSGVYAEAADGRPFFCLPFCQGTLVGTTDLPFDGDPRSAVATEEEIQYLLQAVNTVFPQVGMARRDVHLTYAGIRPLPSSPAAAPSAITRGHRIHEHSGADVLLISLIGGKLTTGRSVAEEIVDVLLARLGLSRSASSRQRFLPGGENYPGQPSGLAAEQQQVARRRDMSLDQVKAVWSLVGSRTDQVLALLAQSARTAAGELHQNVPQTDLPRAFVRWVIREQWVRTVSDLVERRLMLLFHPGLSRLSLEVLGELLAQEHHLAADQIALQVQHCCDRLVTHFGKSLVESTGVSA